MCLVPRGQGETPTFPPPRRALMLETLRFNDVRTVRVVAGGRNYDHAKFYRNRRGLSEVVLNLAVRHSQ